MAKLRSLARHTLDSLSPSAATLFRSLRDERAAGGVARDTPFGFTLIGSPSQASGTYEESEVGIFLEHLKEAEVCIDVGANVGFYTCLAASRHKHVIAFEPLHGNLKALYANLDANGFLDVEVYPLGLAGTAGIRRLFGGNTGASFLPDWAGTPREWSRIVPATTLDLLLNSRFSGKQILIKVDVEGFEVDVLKGARLILESNPKPTWLMEICLDKNQPKKGGNPRFLETFEIFWASGYEARTADAERRLVDRSDVMRWTGRGETDFGGFNYLFSRAQSRGAGASPEL